MKFLQILALAILATGHAYGQSLLPKESLPVVLHGRLPEFRTDVKGQNTAIHKGNESAILRGLEWLQTNQNPDGSWGESQRSAMTGFALMAFLAHGEVPDSPKFGPTVKKAVSWLANLGISNNGWLSGSSGGNGGPAVYAHGIATMALGEYYCMTNDGAVREDLVRAVAYIIDGQNVGGGWDYGYAKGTRQDLSVTGWQIQALAVADLTGLKLLGVRESLNRAMVFVEQWQGDGGGFGYDKPGSKYSLTGSGVWCTILWKGTSGETCRRGMEYLLANARGKERVKYQAKTANLYAWYYNTLACRFYNLQAWREWSKLLDAELCAAQSGDGSWPVNGGVSHGPEKEAGGDGPIYRTTLCTMMLQSYYRYMPPGQ